jgi:CRP-like cAMP-binding protein
MDATEVITEKGEELIRQGDTAVSLYMIFFGIGEVFKTLLPHDKAYGSTKVVSFGKVMTGNVVGERTLLNPRGSTYQFTVRAYTRMRSYRIDLHQIRFEVWRPEVCRHLKGMCVFAPDDPKLLQHALDLEKWQLIKARVLTGEKEAAV